MPELLLDRAGRRRSPAASCFAVQLAPFALVAVSALVAPAGHVRPVTA
jgi:hypothetical protein